MNTFEVATALDMANPDYLVTVTHLPVEWSQIRKALHALVQYLRRRDIPFRWSFSVEPNPSGIGTHAHGWMRGGPLEETALAHAPASLGVGRLHAIETYTSGEPLPYAMKQVQGSLALPVAVMPREVV